MKNIKENKGITLIALVVTIIVLLLLAGISISMLSGQDGILTKASSAKEETKETEDYEGVVLAAQSALTEGLGKVDLAEGGDLETTLGSEYTYLGEGLVEKDGKYFRVGEDGSVTKGKMRVGDIVEYEYLEVENVVWNAEYSGAIKSYLLSENQILNNQEDFKVKSWRVWDIKEDGTVELISDEPTTGTVPLGYIDGYNNAVKLLDDACEALYGNINKGIVGRSIKIEDIERKMNNDALKRVKQECGYETQKGGTYTSNYYYPTIYEEENLSVINEIKNTNGFGLSQQDKFYESYTQPESIEGTTKSIAPYQTFWWSNDENMGDMIGDLLEKTGIEYELIMPKGVETNSYWVASRAISNYEGCAYFYVRNIYDGKISGYYMYCSENNYDCKSKASSIRPIISLDSDLLVRNVAEDGTVTWSVK